MLVDVILDRKAGGIIYTARGMYNYCSSEGELYSDIARALDGGTENDVKNELCKYIIGQGYNSEICDYINAVKWLDE